MDRITQRDVRGAAFRYERAARRIGLIADGARLEVSTGSKVNGIAWRVYVIPEGSSGHHHPPAGRDFLGMTAREAHAVLADRAAVLEDVAHAQMSHDITDVTTDDHALVIRFERPTARDRAAQAYRRARVYADENRPGRVCCGVPGPVPRHCLECGSAVTS